MYATATNERTNDFLSGVMGLMTLGLGITAVVAYYCMQHPAFLKMNTGVIVAICLLELLLVVVITMTAVVVPLPVAIGMFTVFAAANGVTIAPLVNLYTPASVGLVFAITSITFGVAAFCGYTMKTDLTSFGGVLLMILTGLLVTMVANIFIGSSRLDWMVSLIAVPLFVGYTAYDMQKIKNMEGSSTDMFNGNVVVASLGLYLDYLNLFVHLLRLVGTKKD